MVLKEVIIHTDGGCEGNPGPGGWAAVLRYGHRCRDIFGVEPATTNNRMELRAAIEALRALKEPCAVTLFTDSEYLRNGITAWIHGWRRNGWRTKDKKPVRNSDLWRELDAVARLHTLKWEWLKGHAGHPDNERCDALARNAIADLRTRYSRAALQDALAKFKESQEDKSETLF